MARYRLEWTEEEKQIVREHYHEQGSAWIRCCELPNRSVQSIEQVASRMGIKTGRLKQIKYTDLNKNDYLEHAPTPDEIAERCQLVRMGLL